MPGGAKAGAGVEAQYRAAVEMTLADGEINRDEERHLAEKADEFGVSHARAHELRREVEADLGGDA